MSVCLCPSYPTSSDDLLLCWPHVPADRPGAYPYQAPSHDQWLSRAERPLLQQPVLGPPQRGALSVGQDRRDDLLVPDRRGLEQSANNPAGMRGTCGATVALYIGDEAWAGLRANFTDGKDASEQFNLLNLEGGTGIRQGKIESGGRQAQLAQAPEPPFPPLDDDNRR